MGERERKMMAFLAGMVWKLANDQWLNMNEVQQLDNIQALVLESPAGFQGVQTCTLTYTLPSCIQEEESRILLLPLVPEGLAYPIDRLSFRVTLPGNFSEMPVFTSGYYGEDVDNYMTISVSGPEITGSINTVLRDQDLSLIHI